MVLRKYRGCLHNFNCPYFAVTLIKIQYKYYDKIPFNFYLFNKYCKYC